MAPRLIVIPDVRTLASNLRPHSPEQPELCIDWEHSLPHRTSVTFPIVHCVSWQIVTLRYLQRSGMSVAECNKSQPHERMVNAEM